MQYQFLARVVRMALSIAALVVIFALGISVDGVRAAMPVAVTAALGAIALVAPWALLLLFLAITQISGGRVAVPVARPPQDGWLLMLTLCLVAFGFWAELQQVATVPVLGSKGTTIPGMVLTLVCLVIRVMQLRHLRPRPDQLVESPR